MTQTKLVPGDLEPHRDLVIQRLSEGFVADKLDVEEYESRLDRAHRASDVATLDALVADIQAPATTSAIAPAQPSSWSLVERAPDSGWAIACFGGATRGGTWTVPRSLKVVASFGGVDLDFREARFEAGVTDVFVLAMFGGVDIIVPPGVAVECHGSAIFGGFDDCSRSAASASHRPVVRVHGLAMLGGVDITTRLPGESARQARKRLKKERAQAQLPAGTKDR